MNEMPTWEGFMIHALAALEDGSVRKRREIATLAAGHASLTDEQLNLTLGSGQLMYENRVGWAISYLTNVGALARPSRGQYVITDAGRHVLSTHPGGVKEADFVAFVADPDVAINEYVATQRAASKAAAAAVASGSTALDPTEQVEEGIARIQAVVSAELLARLLQNDPAFFEQAVVDLLVAMGYGGAGGAATVTQKSNDGGIDGVIDQDTLGLNRVYVQAKRYAVDRTVQRPDLQAFVGALSGKADGGVFITTATFSSGAIEYANSVPTRLILIDGARLTDLMIRYGVGVQVKDTYRVVEIDEDFFE